MATSNSGRCRIALVAAMLASLLVACAPTPPLVVVDRPELPEYRVDGHRIEAPIDVHVESRLALLYASVQPVSHQRSYQAATIVVGPAIESALVSLTKQHFSAATKVDEAGDRPLLKYRLLAFKPVANVQTGSFGMRLDVSARVALQVSVDSVHGEELFAGTIVGTSHLTDSRLPQKRVSDESARLLKIATHNAIVDAMYDLSRMFDDRRSNLLGNRALQPASGESQGRFSDVVLYLRTWQPDAD